MKPKCSNCARLYRPSPRGVEGLSCTAFPLGIPADILSGRVSHRIPFEGDNGFLYDPIEPDPLEEGELEPAGEGEILAP